MGPQGEGGPRAGPRPPIQAPQCSDYRQVAPRGPRQAPPAAPDSRLAGLVVAKLADLCLHLYTLGLAAYTLAMAVLVIHQDSSDLLLPDSTSLNSSTSPNTSAPAAPSPPPSCSNSSLTTSLTSSSHPGWWEEEVTVLGKSKWTMSFNHFILLFAIFHIVYGVIAAVCDLIFFHTLARRTVASRYVSTVLPVHRMFFVVICWIDAILFGTSTNITSLVDAWAVAAVLVVTVAATLDTAVVLASLRAVEGQPALLFSSPWRNGGVAAVLLLTSLYTLVSQYLGGFTWEAGPSLVLALVALLVLLASLWHTTTGATALDTTTHFFLCVSASSVLGLFAVGLVLHTLLLRPWCRPQFDSF